MSILKKMVGDWIMSLKVKRATGKATKIYKQNFSIETAIWTGQYETDIEYVAKNLGLNVYITNIKDHFQNTAYPKDISGFLLKDNDEYAIFVNENDSETRQRFTIAHEIGHYILGHLKNEEYKISYRDELTSKGTDMHEIEANAFAAELLMPEELISFAYRRTSDTSELADWFNVSTDAIEIRLRNLGFGVIYG